MIPPFSDFLIYLTGACVVSAAVHFVLRTWLAPLWPQSRRRLPWLLLAALYPFGMLGLLCMNVLPRRLATPLFFTCFGWLGLSYFLLGAALLSSPLSLIVRLCGSLSGARRESLPRTLRRFAVGLAVSLTLYSSYQGLRPPALAVRRVELPRWPAAYDGFRIAHLSDLHVGATIGRAEVQATVDAVNAQAVDVVLITGDLVDGSVAELARELAPLSDLRSRYGTFLALGNHEYFSPTEDWVRHLPSLGITVLRNQWLALPPCDLVGIDEWSAPEFTPAHRPDLPAALAGRDPQRPAVVLVHQPQALWPLRQLNRQARQAGQPPVADLQLSGHTHGGQIVPLGLLAQIQQGQLQGLSRRDDLVVHVTSGVGYWGPPMRLGSRAEIAILVLSRPGSFAVPTIGPPAAVRDLSFR